MKLEANIAGRGFCRVEWQGGRIEAVTPLREEIAGAPFCSAGFVDLQVNGVAGVDFGDPALTPETAISTLRPLWRTGVTTFCPTVITAPLEALRRSFAVLEQARRISGEFAASAACYHLEGPYLSPGPAHGAHDPAVMRNPDWDEFCSLQDAAGGNIGIVTLAPELPGAIEFIERAARAGVLVAIGHTDGGAGDIERACHAGARLSTHLGNGCPEYIHRHRSPIWAQLAAGVLKASLICDGFHLTPEFVSVVARLKGPWGCVLVTDSIHVAGMLPGRYELGGMPVELDEAGKVTAVQNPGALAGSTLRMNRAIPRFQREAGVDLHAALLAATHNPAQLLGRPGVARGLEYGEPANIVIFRPGTDELVVDALYLDGIVPIGC